MILNKLISIFYKNQKNQKNQNTLNIDNKSSIIKDESSHIENCNISLVNSKIKLNKNTILKNYNFTLNNANVTISEYSILDGELLRIPTISIDNGNLEIGHHSKIRASIIIRFSGVCKIGNYNAINEGTEIRVDESLIIGDFNMISYDCYILDTNSHSRLSVDDRRKLTIKEYPTIGSEYSKPPTNPIEIGSDCWFGKDVTVLKGVKIGDGAILGTKSVITKEVYSNYLAYGNPAQNVKINN